MPLVLWHPEVLLGDLPRIPAHKRAMLKAKTEVYLSQSPPAGKVKGIELPAPWGSIEQLSIEDYRVLYEVANDGTVLVLLVFEKPLHLDTVTAMQLWLANVLDARRTR